MFFFFRFGARYDRGHRIKRNIRRSKKLSFKLSPIHSITETDLPIEKSKSRFNLRSYTIYHGIGKSIVA